MLVIDFRTGTLRLSCVADWEVSPIELAFELLRTNLRRVDLLLALRGCGRFTCFFSWATTVLSFQPGRMLDRCCCYSAGLSTSFVLLSGCSLLSSAALSALL